LPILLYFDILSTMTSNYDKLVDMLATIKEMRKSLAPRTILGFIADNSPVNQKDLFMAFPEISQRTMRRRIDILIAEGRIKRQRTRKDVIYAIYPHN